MQQKSERELAGDEQAMHESSTSAAGMSASAGLNQLAEGGARKLPGRRDAGERTSNQRQQSAENQDHAVDLDGGFMREGIVGNHGGKSADTEIGGDNTEERADGGDEDGFGEELLNEARALRANGDAHGEFVLAGGAAGEKKNGDVGATDEEQGHDRAE